MSDAEQQDKTPQSGDAPNAGISSDGHSNAGDSGTGNPGASSSGIGAYRNSLLGIKAPVTVTLAERKESLRNILALVPGSMLTFDTHCDKPLSLSIGGHTIATGETVKIGDKFGLRVRQVGAPKQD